MRSLCIMLAFGVWTAVGCTNGDDMLQPDEDPPVFEIQLPAPSAHLSHVPGSRRTEEAAAIQELLAHLPNDETREGMKRMLSASMTQPVSSTDPKVANLLRKIYEIRQADIIGEATMRSREDARRHPTLAYVALVDNVPMEGARAMVLRRMGRFPPTLILVSRNATATDLASAVSTVSAHRKQFGDFVLNEMRARVPERATPIPEAHQRYYQKRLEELRAAPKQQIEGFGEVPAIRLKIAPVRDSKDRKSGE